MEVNFVKVKNTLGLTCVRYIEEVSSTQEVARRVRKKPPYLIVAGHQTDGKGRMGRSWSSEKGGLYLTLVITRFPHDWAATITSAYLVRKALSSYLKDLILKWPNDLLYGKAKLAGILAESRGQRLCIGIGVNVNQRLFSDELAGKATSLYLARGRTFDIEEAFLSVTSIIVKGLRDITEKGFEFYYRDIRQVLLTSSQRIRIKSREGFISGQLLDISREGNVLIKIHGDKQVKVPAGQILGGYA